MPNLSLLRIEKYDEAVVLLGVGDVGEGVGVEGFQEAVESSAEGRLEAADGDDGGGVGFEFEAFDDFKIRFAGADDADEVVLGHVEGSADVGGADGAVGEVV